MQARPDTWTPSLCGIGQCLQGLASKATFQPSAQSHMLIPHRVDASSQTLWNSMDTSGLIP